MFAVAGFVLGFVLVLSVPFALLDAMLGTPDPTTLPAISASDVRFFSGVGGIGLLLAFFSVIIWFLVDAEAAS